MKTTKRPSLKAQFAERILRLAVDMGLDLPAVVESITVSWDENEHPTVKIEGFDEIPT